MPKWFSSAVFDIRRLGEQVIGGYSEDEFYPHLVYVGDFLPRAVVVKNEEWVAKNEDLLPEALEGFSFQNVKLLVRMTRSYKLVFWQVYCEPTEITIGHGMLGLSEDGAYYDVVTAIFDFEGFELYPNVLKVIARELGPLRSDRHLSTNANKVWAKLGAQFLGDRIRRWVLNPK